MAGLVSGCTGAPSPQPARTPQPTRAAHSLAGLRDVRPCPGIAGFNCGSLSVRLDPFGSVPGQLSLRVAVSDVASAPRGILLFLTGGPGEPGVPFVSRITGRLGPALRGYRLVMFDQRGTGAGALDCPALQRQMGASDLTVPGTTSRLRWRAHGLRPRWPRTAACSWCRRRATRCRTGPQTIRRRPNSPGSLAEFRCAVRSRSRSSRRSTAPGPGGTPVSRDRRAGTASWTSTASSRRPRRRPAPRCGRAGRPGPRRIR